MVFLDVILSTFFFFTQQKIFIPIKLRQNIGTVTQQIKRCGPIKHGQANPINHVADIRIPIIVDSGAVIVAVVDKRLGLKTKRAGGTGQAVLNVCGVGSLLHPNTFFQQGVGDAKGPNGDGAFQVKTVDVMVAVGFHRAV